jgi:Zn-dependent peptidase ImmA (M78 family)/transcriptional regulator with XRE-family HTH domain
METRERKPFNPEMLVVARKSRGLTQSALATRLSMQQAHISKIESGVLNPPEKMIKRLPQVLNYKEEFFFWQGKIFGIGTAIVYHRMRQGISTKLLDKIEAQINVYQLHINNLLRSVNIPECRIPFYDPDESEGPVNVARAVRALWKLPSGPIKNLVRAIEDAGGIVIPYDFGTKKIDGLGQYMPPLPPLFFVNVNIPGDRCRFSLAHELGHVIMHSIPRPDMEREANQFAGEFLMPYRDIAQSLQSITLDKLADLKMYWKVSMQSLLYRAKELKSVPERKMYYLWMQMSRLGYRTKEPIDIPREQPSTLTEIIETYINKLNYTVPEICQMLGIHESEFTTLYKKRHLRLAS